MISDRALAVSLRSPNYFVSINYHNKLRRSYDHRSVSVRCALDVSTGYGFAIFKNL